MRSERSEFPKAVKLAAWQRCKGHCEGCGCKIIAGNGPEYDHYPVPAALGGSNDLDNCQVLCKKPCHSLKTATKDIPTIAKCQAIFEKRIGARAKSSRPLPGSKRSGLRKKMDGTVERRG